VGGLAVWRATREQMQDPEFLQQQLDLLGPQNSQSEGGSPPALISVGTAQRKTIQPHKPIIGRLVEVRKVTVASEVTGRVVDLPVEEGTPVVADQTVLARIDDVWCRLALERCKAQVASAEAELEFERLELERHRQLSDTRAVSQSDVESQQATVDKLEASLAEAKTAVEEGTERTKRSVILAPFDGTVIAKQTELGGYVSPGTPIVEVVSGGEMDARLMVPESVINLIRMGQNLPIQIDPLGDTVEGKVVSVTPYGPAASRTFPVRVRVDDQGGRLKVGMGVTAMIATGPEREALVVSRDAVLVRPDGSTVWVAVPQAEESLAEVHPVPVTVGVRMPEEYAVEAETEEGRSLLVSEAQVVVEGAERLMPGQQVRIIPRENGQGEVAGPRASLRPVRTTTPAASAGGSSGGQES
jgi:RND family efflux transporter MFP subunit